MLIKSWYNLKIALVTQQKKKKKKKKEEIKKKEKIGRGLLI